MKLFWIFMGISCVQCTNGNNEIDQPEIVYITDTVYLEKEILFERKPWKLECIDTAWTNYDLILCSQQCLEIADSVLDETYRTILENYEVQLSEIKKTNYEEVYPQYNQVLKNQKSDFEKLYKQFNAIKLTVSNLISAQMGDGRLRNFYVNAYVLGIVEDQIKLYESLEPELFEIE